MNYMYKILNRFNVSDFKRIAPLYLEMSASELENEITKRKLPLNKKNLLEFVIWKIKKDRWSINDIVKAVFDLDLDYVIKYSNRFEWTANKFIGTSSEKEIPDLSESIRSTIRKNKRDASVLVKEVDDFFWISISLKNLKKIGIYEKPHFIVLSGDGKYFFTKDSRYESVIKYITATLGFEKEKRQKLSGRSLPSLLKLLIRKENADMQNRPVYECVEAVESEYGLDFTQKKNYLDYYDKCVDNENDINLQSYTVTIGKINWRGDDNLVLRQMEMRAAVTLSGNVARIIKQLPLSSIVKPPLPNYLKNFSVYGRNVVSIKSPSQ